MRKKEIIGVDLLIFGAGIAGLWTLTRARQLGYSALLIENQALGGVQTIASQGMIHGGLKYALGGKLSSESESIAQMPDLWQRCLNFNTQHQDSTSIPAIDLSQTRVLSRDFYLFSSGLVGRLGSFFASKNLRGRIEHLKTRDHPALLKNTRYKGSVYRLVDQVVDVPSLIKNLAALNQNNIFKIDDTQLSWDCSNSQIMIQPNISIKAQQFIFCAGKGNQALLNAWHEHTPKMQLRPLQQVIVKHRLAQSEFYGHCVGSQLQASPRLTISTHHDDDGSVIWYLGGDLATKHTELDKQALIEVAQRELAQIFPWLNFENAQWDTVYIERAEPKQNNLLKPDTSYVHSNAEKPIITAWPTKLTLAPDMAEKILSSLQHRGIQKTPLSNPQALTLLNPPTFALTPWQQSF